MNVSPKVVDEFMGADNKKQEVMTLRFLLDNLRTQLKKNQIHTLGKYKGGHEFDHDSKIEDKNLHYFLCRSYEYIEDKLDEIQEENA